MRRTTIPVLMAAALLGLLSSAWLPPAQAEPAVIGTPPNDCLTIGWTSDPSAGLETMLNTDGIVIGTTLHLYSDCGEFILFVDSIPTTGGTRYHTIPISIGNHNITIESEDSNWSYSWNNVTFYPASDVWVGEYPTDEPMITVPERSILWDEMFAHILTAIILFTLSTTVVYRFASWRVDRTVEVVI